MLPIVLVIGGLAALGICACGGVSLMGFFFAGMAHHDMVHEDMKMAVMAQDDMKMDMELKAEEEMFAKKDWKPEHGEFKRLQIPGLRGDIRALSFTADGASMLAATSAESVHSWDLATWNVRTPRLGNVNPGFGGQEVGAAAFTPNGDKVFVGRHGGSLCSYDLTREPASQKRIQIGDPGRQLAFNHIAVSRDGTRICTSHGDSVAYVWEVATLNKVTTLKDFKNQVGAGAFHPNSEVVAAAAEDVQVYDPKAKDVTHFKADGPLWFKGLEFSPDGRFLSGVKGNSLHHWRTDAAKGGMFKAMDPYDQRATHLAYSPDGLTLAVAVHHTRAYLYDVATVRQRFMLDLRKGRDNWDTPAAIAFHPDSRRFAVARGATIYLFNLDGLRKGK